MHFWQLNQNHCNSAGAITFKISSTLSESPKSPFPGGRSSSKATSSWPGCSYSRNPRAAQWRSLSGAFRTTDTASSRTLGRRDPCRGRSWRQGEYFARRLGENRRKILTFSSYSSLFNHCILQQNIHSWMKVLFSWYDWLNSNIGLPLDLIVYLRTSPEVAYERLRKRGRKEEAGVPLEFLEVILFSIQ